MKVVLFAGGKGSRISEESTTRPKPMVEIGGKPILWHIMKGYAQFGHEEFIVCLGYKGYLIKEYFINYFRHNADLTVDLGNKTVEGHQTRAESFRVTLVDTGVETMTAGRLKRVREHVGDETFLMTYGDGVSDVDLDALVAHHEAAGTVATVTAVQAPGRFGLMEIDDTRVSSFVEKPQGDGGWINGGFFVLSPKVFDYLPENADDIMWEQDPMAHLARDDQLSAYRHAGFWKPMDTLRDKTELEQLWATNAPWKTW